MAYTGDNYADAWMAGYATALANMHRLYHETSAVEGTMIGDGITIEILRKHKVASYDLNELRKCARKPAAIGRSTRSNAALAAPTRAKGDGNG